MKKGFIVLALNLLFVNCLLAEEIYRINRYKKSNKISSRSVMINGDFLQQSYDLNGNIILETYTKDKKTISECITNQGLKFNSTTGDSEKYFSCLLILNEIVSSQNGIKEENSSEIKRANDLTFKDKGRGLNK